MWVFDHETLRFLAVNDAAISHYGYSHEEFMQTTVATIRATEDVPRLIESLSTIGRGLDLREGVNFLGKPFEPADLLRCVRAQLDSLA